MASIVSEPLAKQYVDKQATNGSDTPPTTPPDRIRQVPVAKVQPLDVLWGRHRVSFHHPGNQVFRNLVHLHRDSYQSKALRSHKLYVVTRIRGKITDSGGRFLRQRGDEWYLATHEEVHEKISHALRSSRADKEVEPVCEVEPPYEPGQGALPQGGKKPSKQQNPKRRRSSPAMLQSPPGKIQKKGRAEIKFRTSLNKVALAMIKYVCQQLCSNLKTKSEEIKVPFCTMILDTYTRNQSWPCTILRAQWCSST